MKLNFNPKAARVVARHVVLTVLPLILCVSARAQAPQTDGAPAAQVVTPPSLEKFHLYLLMGQSNMSGDTSEIAPQLDDPHILALNEEGQWVVAHDPLFSSSGSGPGIAFAAQMLKTNPGLTIGLVPCARGGSGLSRWVKGGELYQRAVERATIARQSGTLKGVLWHQGESDTRRRTNAERYESHLTKMFGDLRAELQQPDLPIVIGQLGEFLKVKRFPYVDTVRAALAHIPSVVPNVGYADSAGLPDKGDELHFSAQSQQQMGVRYAKAMLALQKTATDAKKNGATPQKP